ncbi:MAG: ATP-binding protein [Candidatus Omnitrophica bacterium]|nr:ATP-binding protein [Candidatus Omnitrophota bacterium]
MMFLKDYYGIASILTAVSTLFLAAFVFFKGRGKPLNLLYSFWALCVGLWSVFLVLNIYAPTQSQALLWCRLLHVWAIILPAVYVHFVFLFLDKLPSRRRLINFLYGIAAVFVVIDFTPWFITVSYRPQVHFFVTQPLVLYPYHVLIFVLSVFYVYFELALCLWKATGIRRKQVQYFLVATLIGYSGGVTNYLINYNLFIFPLYPFGNYTVCAYVVIIGLGILRYRLMDIEVIVKKTLVFAGLFAMAMAIVAVVTTVTQNYIGQYFRLNLLWTRAISVVIAILLYEPTKGLLINLTDRFLFQKKFRLTTMVAQASQAIALVQSLKWLARRIVAFLVTTCRIKHAVVYIRDRDHAHFVRGAHRGYTSSKNLPEKIERHHPLIRYLEKNPGPVEVTRLTERVSNNKQTEELKNEIQEISNFLKAANAEVVIPSFLRRRIDLFGAGREKSEVEREIELRDILILGAKKSDEPYSDEELEVFHSLAQESAIAIENARLYDEAVQRSKLLAEINKELEETNEKLRVTQASLIVAEKNATMVGMAKAIAHEINNPLSTVDGRSRYICRDYAKIFRDLLNRYGHLMSEEDRAKFDKAIHDTADYASRINTSASRIGVVVKTLTNILKDTKGEMGPLSLIVMCREALEAARFSTYEENLGGCEMKLDMASNVVIQGNLEQLLQVFVNLIKNAYEAMGSQRDRQVIIRGGYDPEDPKMARIEVADNGPGIPPDILPKIWTQGFSTKKRKNDDSLGAPGQGQGLFVCKHIIESVHNGVIYAESEVGKGTTFIIKLPLAEL